MAGALQSPILTQLCGIARGELPRPLRDVLAADLRRRGEGDARAADARCRSSGSSRALVIQQLLIPPIDRIRAEAPGLIDNLPAGDPSRVLLDRYHRLSTGFFAVEIARGAARHSSSRRGCSRERRAGAAGCPGPPGRRCRRSSTWLAPSGRLGGGSLSCAPSAARDQERAPPTDERERPAASTTRLDRRTRESTRFCDERRGAARWRRGRGPARWAPRAASWPLMRVEAAGEQEARRRGRAGAPPRRHPALERVPQQEARAEAEQHARRDDRPPELPQRRERRRGSRRSGAGSGPAPRKWRRPIENEVDPERHQRHAEVQAPAGRRRSSSPRERGRPRSFADRLVPVPAEEALARPSCRSGPRPRASSGSPEARSGSDGSSASSVSAIARRTSRPTRSLVLSGPIRCP